MEVFNIEDRTDVRKTIEGIKGGSRILMLVFFIMGLFCTGMIAIANIGGSIIPPLGSAAFFGIALLIIFILYMKIETGFKKLKSDLGVGSDEEMNEFLKSFTKFSDTLFVSDQCFINLNNQKVCFYSEIKSISKHHYRSRIRHRVYHTYNISIHMKNFKQNCIGFNDEKTRDRLYHIITTSAAFAEASGYTSILSDADNE